MQLEHSKWEEKYRPTTIEEYLVEADQLELINGWISKKDIPHLLLSGPPGIGKTTLAKFILKYLDCESEYFNCSESTGIDTIRNKVLDFARSASFSSLKVILMDEADRLSQEAQDSLKAATELFSMDTRFIFITNHPERIDRGLATRFYKFTPRPSGKREVYIAMRSMLQNENIQFDKEVLASHITMFYPCLREIVISLENASVSGILKTPNIPPDTYLDKILTTLLSDNNTEEIWKSIQIESREYKEAEKLENLYQHLFNNADKFPKDKLVSCMGIIARWMNSHKMAPDPEINWMGCVAELILTLKK